MVVACPTAAACGHGAPGGFPAALRGTPATAAPGASATASPAAVPSASPNTAAQGSPVPGPTTSEPAVGESRVTVTLAQGQVTPSVKEVQARRLQFVVSNDEDVVRAFDIATVSGTRIVGTGDVPPGQIRTLVVEVVPGRYLLVASGGGGAKAMAPFTVSA